MPAPRMRSLFLAVALSVGAVIPAMATPEAEATTAPTPAIVPVNSPANNNALLPVAEQVKPAEAQPVAAAPAEEKLYNYATSKALISVAKEAVEEDTPEKQKAAETAIADKISQLLKQNADPSNEDGEAFCNAVLNGNIYAVRVLLEEGHVDPNIRGGDAMTLAALRGHDAIVNLLIDHGMDPNGIRKNGRPLASAASNDHASTIETLIARGADVNINNSFALANAAMIGAIDGVKALIANKAHLNDNGVPLYSAIAGKQDEMFKLLIDSGTDINANDGEAMRMAVTTSRKDIVAYLLDHGANINVGNGRVLRTALDTGKPEMVKFLLERGADSGLSSVMGGLAYIAQNPEKHSTQGHKDAVALIKQDHVLHPPKTELPTTAIAPAPLPVFPDVTPAPASERQKVGIERYEGQLQYDDTDGTSLVGNIYALAKGTDRNSSFDKVEEIAKSLTPDLVEISPDARMDEIKKLLAKKTTDPNFHDGLPLEQASVLGELTVMQMLIDAGADVNVGEGDCLLAAADNGKKEAVQFLIDHNINLFAYSVELILENYQLVKADPRFAESKFAKPVYGEIVDMINAARKAKNPDYVPKVYQAVPDGKGLYKSQVPNPSP